MVAAASIVNNYALVRWTSCPRLALPLAALTHMGDRTYCWLYKDGKAESNEIRAGVSDGEWIEVTNYQVPSAADGSEPWAPVKGSEQVILGDLSILADGGPVEVLPATGKIEEKVATATLAPAATRTGTSGTPERVD